jgi:DNA-binding MarR family transcriptional regulator
MNGAKDLGGLELDRTIHEKARLMILAFLSSSSEPETGFKELRDALGLSAGNLSIQLKNLDEAGYVDMEKGYRNNKPYTAVRLTAKGRRSLEAYLAELEVVVASLKGTSFSGTGTGGKPGRE